MIRVRHDGGQDDYGYCPGCIPLGRVTTYNCMTAFSRSTYETLLGIKHNRKPAPGISFDVCFERRV